MFTEYVPFTIKYLYYILIVVTSFVLFKKFLGRPDERTAQSETYTFTASNESTDPSESNVTVNISTCKTLKYFEYMCLTRSYRLYSLLILKKSVKKQRKYLTRSLFGWDLKIDHFVVVTDKDLHIGSQNNNNIKNKRIIKKTKKR